MIEKNFGKKRILQASVIALIFWGFGIYQVIWEPDYFLTSRFKMPITYGVYLFPFAYIVAIFIEWRAFQKRMVKKDLANE